MWHEDGPQGGETLKVHDRLAPFIYGHGADLGCGFWKLKVAKSKDTSCIGVDGGYHINATSEIDVIADVTNLKMFANECFDYVYSSHTLEDLHYTEAVLREWWRLVKPGGNLILYLPLTRRVAKEMGIEGWGGFYPNMGEPGVNVYHVHDFNPQQIRDYMAKIGDIEVLADEVRGEKDEYSFLQVFRKIGSDSTIQCLCEYHRRHCAESMEQRPEGMENESAHTEITEGYSGAQPKALNNRLKECVV